MENIFSLSYENIKRLHFDKYEKNFTFNVNGKRYETSRVFADILSPIINDYHYNDESFDEFNINFNIEKIIKSNHEARSTDYFQDFLQLNNFDSIEIDELHRKFYCEFLFQLGNFDEYFRLQPKISDLTIENVINNLDIISQNFANSNNFKIFDSPIFKQIIDFTASHFCEIDKEEMKKVDGYILKEIIQNKNLKLDEEDSLFNFIIEMYEQDPNYSIFFENVIFKNLTDKALEKFVNIFSIDSLNLNIWRSICERLLSTRNNDNNKERYNGVIKEISYKEGEEFKGIMNYLTEITGSNIHDNGTIEITSNSILNNDEIYHPKKLVDYQNKGKIYESSNNNPNIIICFDFKDNEIQLTNYSIKSYNGDQNTGHLRNWVIEVSNDNEEWEIVDKHNNDSCLRGPNIIKTFNTKQTKLFYRFIRIRQTGISWYNLNNNNDHYKIYFPFFEIYGKIKLFNCLK